MPLVLHGGTGIPAEMVKKAITLGVSKVNVNTECQLAFAAATRKSKGQRPAGQGLRPPQAAGSAQRPSRLLSRKDGAVWLCRRQKLLKTAEKRERDGTFFRTVPFCLA